MENGDDVAPIVRRPPSARAKRDRGIERRVVLLALLGIAVLTALVIVAWKFGGNDSSNSTPSVVTTQGGTAAAASTLRLTGVRTGTYVEVRRSSSRGKVLLQATIPAGHTEVRTARASGSTSSTRRGLRVSLHGKPVALPARKNLRVVVTPTRTALVSG